MALCCKLVATLAPNTHAVAEFVIFRSSGVRASFSECVEKRIV